MVAFAMKPRYRQSSSSEQAYRQIVLRHDEHKPCTRCQLGIDLYQPRQVRHAISIIDDNIISMAPMTASPWRAAFLLSCSPGQNIIIARNYFGEISLT